MKHRIFSSILSFILCLTLLTAPLPVASVAAQDDGTRAYIRLAELNDIKAVYLSDSEARAAQYPNGAITLVETAAELEMNQTYAIDIVRQGGTAGEAKIKLSTVDMTAGYGEDYRLHLTDQLADEGVEGSKLLYYYESGVPYIARRTQHEEYYMTPEDADDLGAARDEASDINDMAADNMPHSTESLLTFAEGETCKTVFIETMMKDEVTDDLEFMLVLSEPENCSISASVSGVYTIKENRPKPRAKLEIASTSVNPASDEALVCVTRSGNLGGYDTFRVTTKSDTAIAEQDYIAVAQDLRFAPGVSEIKVPVTLLEGAKDGRQFSVELSDAAGNADIAASVATVSLDKSKEIVTTGAETKKYVTDFTYKTNSYREYEFVDLSKFHSEKVLGDWDDGSAKYESNKWRLDYDQSSWKNHAVDAMSPSKIDFTGVKSIRFCYDNAGGSCKWDHAAVKLSETNPLDNGDRDCDWMSSLGGCDGVSWSLWDTGPSHLNQTINSPSGNKFIYLVLHKGGFWGASGVKFHDYTGDKDCSFRLNLQDYSVSIIDPAPISLFKNGKLESVRAVTNAQFTNPNATSASYTTEATFYRYDTTTIKAAVDSKYGTATFKGIYICNPDDTSKHSSLITLSGGNFTLSPQVISGYSSYIVNNKFVIQPVYEFEKINFKVESYSDADTGVTFTADNANHTGVFTVDGAKYGTVTWSYDSSRSGYYDGDELIFTFSPEQGDSSKTVAYEYRCADVESDLKSAQWVKTGSAADRVGITLSRRNFSVSPYIADLTVKNRLIVTNPNDGDFTSKGTKYAAASSDGSVTVTGYFVPGDADHSTLDESFVNYAPGKRMEYTAKPKNGCYAEWTYTDAVTHQQKTYRGDAFYYTVQNPFHLNDNTVTLSFKPSAMTYNKFISAPLSGSITVPKGTILHPATSSTDIRVPAVGALIYMDGFTGQTDENGQFKLVAEPGSSVPAAVTALGKAVNFTPGMAFYSGLKYAVDETHRALIHYNGNDYICDIKLSANAFTISSFSVEIALESSTTLGVMPIRTEAFSVDTGVYGDSITLVDARSVNFSVDFDARNIPASKPINLARWSFESDDGMQRSSADIPIEKGSSTALYACVVKEKAKPGDHLFIEFYNKSYDSASNEKYTYYGKYEVGYQFVPANVEEVISYMPDIGFYDEEAPAETGGLAPTGVKYAKTPEAPAIGPISPMFSIFGFLPTYSDAATGQKDQKTGKDLYVLEIGVQFSVAKTQTADDNGKWSASSVAKQWDKLAKIIDKSPGELAQNMQTSTKISLTVSFAYQLEYYTSDSGVRCYTQSLFLLGGKIGVRISIPFTIVAIPCFVYFDISADNVGYLVHTPNDKTEGYWTSKMLDNSYYYETHGEFSQDFKIQFGVGVGWDGLASIGGHVDFGLKSKIKGTSHGKMTCSVSGGVFAQLLFLKVDKTWNIKEWVLLDTDADLASVSANILNRRNTDLFADTKLGDMTLAKAEDIYDNSVVKGKDLAPTGSDAYAIYTHETYVENNTAQMSPVIGRISDNQFLIATVMNTADRDFALQYYIYNSETNEIERQGSAVTDLITSNNLSDEDDKVKLLLACEDLVGGVNIIDCDDRLLLVWEGCTVEDYTNSSVNEAIDSFRIAAVVYDKGAGKFTDFDIVDFDSDTLPDRIKGVYNPATGMAHIFYESINTEGVSSETTLRELTDQPVSLNTCSIDLNSAAPRFTAPTRVNIRDNTVSDYDVSLYEDDVLVSFISAQKNSLTVEKPLTASAGVYNDEDFGTKNNMFLNRYGDADGKLELKTSILIADENYVTANPEFVKLNYQDVENTLLFFKCNGRYGYQNIENLYIQYEYAGWDGTLKSDVMKPNYITLDEDHTVGEDFKVYASDDGVLYALWTQSEGTQQQIWGRQFQVDSIEKNTSVSVINDAGDVLYNPDGSPQTRQLDKPVHILHGFWGNKARLTTDGIKSDDEAFGTGRYKGRFDAVILDKDQILSTYNSFDYDYGEAEEGTEIKVINNRFIISEFDITSWYYLGAYGEPISVSNTHPTPGETIKVAVHAENNGFSTGRDVSLMLMVAGGAEPVDTIHYPTWLAGEEKDVEFEYTVPADVDIENLQTTLYYQIEEKGVLKYRSEAVTLTSAPRLNIDIAHADAVKEITDDNKTAAYRVTARVTNTGNIPYPGGDELTFIYNDLAAQADVMNKDVPDTKPFYINYGGVEIPEIEVGSSVELSFLSEEIPESVYDEYNTNSANLKLAITPKDGIGWKEVKGEEPYNFLDEIGIGQFEKPVPKEITSVSAQAITVPLGSTAFITPTVTPAASADRAKFTYQADSDIITVDENGLVRGNRRGTAAITVTCGEVSTTLQVVVGKPEVGDTDLDGDITILDATAIQRYLVNLQQLGDEALAQADADRDGHVMILDATTIQRYLASLIYSL